MTETQLEQQEGMTGASNSITHRNEPVQAHTPPTNFLVRFLWGYFFLFPLVKIDLFFWNKMEKE